MNFFSKETKTALQAKEAALQLAFAPVAFQATRALRNLGILKIISDAGRAGISLEDIVAQLTLSKYAVRVLLEAGLGIELLLVNDKKYTLSKMGYFIEYDELTRINMDFTQDICYRGMDHLEEALITGKPAGLRELGPWETIYPGLSLLPPDIGKSWFDFDHYYSDIAYPQVLPVVFASKPRQLLELGGNTGKWALACTGYDPDVQVTILDLPGQMGIATQKIKAAGLEHRVSFFTTDVLNENLPFPDGKFDAIWMSQFLDCFSEAQIIAILQRCMASLADGGRIYILEPFWDRQVFKSAAYCLQQTSLYFTAMANGNSQMYHSDDLIACITAAGLTVISQNDQMGMSYTLLQCVIK
ncbi:O-methyltransferase [Chitinophaga costaii]|uniref:O-methyltransferase n=1 Tax=Chitinophaga costaii TaxID=1335309 RepID=A0A1C3ZHP4_9BACT|nr:class I SAM-dependent methyltransferase [Chitinophaga costaii]PUZ30374.1 class I SAM-dependent methyltransferase [Chitinophaga costaii]SCB81813.1 O-methyltransferase [Chitinophaga costaii]